MSKLYTYRVRDQAGQAIKGVIRGENLVAVETYLESLDFIPVKISLHSGLSFGKLLRLRMQKPKLDDLILITRKLSTLYRAGIPILKSLDIIAEQYEDNYLGKVLLTIQEDVERGELLSDSMAKDKRVFSPIYVASIRAAETSGQLDTVLDKLADALEQELVTREEIKKALRYPVMVILALAAAFIALTTFVIPKFADFYNSYGAELPLPTRMMIFLNELISNYWYMMLAGLFATGFLIVYAVKHPRVKPTIDSLLLKTPVFGNLIVKTSLSRFSHLLSVLIASGTTLIQSLDIVKEAVGNEIIGKEIGRLGSELREGHGLDEAKHHLRHFPKLALSLIHVGLESGTLEMTLAEVSRFFDREVQYTSSRLTSLLEPIMVLVMGVMILFLALAIFLPMWNLISIFRS